MKACETCGNDGNWEIEMSQAITIAKLNRELDDAKVVAKLAVRLQIEAAHDNDRYKAALEEIYRAPTDIARAVVIAGKALVRRRK